MSEVSSTCPYCGVGCGLNVSINSESGDSLVLASKTHPANFGRLCSKGSALGETLVGVKEGNRLTHPMIDGKVADWSQTISTIAQKIEDSIEQYGRNSIAFYLSGQLLTEDYYVANKLMKGFIGTANVDTNSRLCMSSAVAAYKRAFGSDAVPCSYEDLELADLIVLIGSNAAWTHPVLYQRMVAAKKNNPALRVVLIDPRRTVSDDIADLHLPLAPSSDGFLFQGLFNYLQENNALDQAYIDEHTDGFAAAAQSAQKTELSEVVLKTGLDEADLLTFYRWFAETKKTVSFYSQGINQSATGTDKCNAIINCHLASGKIGYQGAGPFSITGQPNAMGGREVGGLANQLAAHMDFCAADTDRVRRFWQSPRIAQQPGLKAVDLFDAVDSGQIKVIWIMATNPAVSLPNSNLVRRALEKCPTVIVSDICHTDTSQYADVLLPAEGWSEKDGTVTNSERRISRQRAFRKAPGTAKPDWWAITQVASELGYKANFDYKSAYDIFIEHATLSGFENNGSRGFDISGLSNITEEQYTSLAPIQWPVTAAQPQGTQRLFTDGRFFTPTGRAQFISTQPQTAECFDAELLLNTGRLRDQWHTMTRTGLAPTLAGHDDVPFVQVNPKDASQHSLLDKQFARLESRFGEFLAQVSVTKEVAPGQLFSPIHWTDRFATNAVVGRVVSPETDPVSGQPELKATAVSIRPFDCKSWARVMSRKPIEREGWAYWLETKTANGFAYLLGVNQSMSWREWVVKTVCMETGYTHYTNPIKHSEFIAAHTDKQIELILSVQPNIAELPSLVWFGDAFEGSLNKLKTLVRGELGAPNKLICGCFKTSEKSIKQAIESGHTSAEQLSSELGCGSKCGSCRPEINRLLLDSF